MSEINRPAEMGYGAGACPHPLRPCQPLLQIGTRQGDGVLHRIIQRHHGGDGAGVTAAGAMAVAGIEARRREPELAALVLVVVQTEIPAPLKMPPLDQHGAGAELPQSRRSCPYQGGAGRRNAGQCLQLGAVGGNEG
ncbi:hypothetical protein D3C78_1322110 [compost metagenome]